MSLSLRMEITSCLTDFLRHPVVEIRLADSEEIVQLRMELEAAKREAFQARAAYGREVNLCLRYEDYLRSIGVNPAALR